MKVHQTQWISASIERLRATIVHWSEDDQRDAWRRILLECGDTYSEVGQVRKTSTPEPEPGRDDSLAFTKDPSGDIPF